MKLPSLYPILDSAFIPAENRREFLTRLSVELADAGVSLLQYRNKQDDDELILKDARLFRQAAPGNLWLIMNDRPDLTVQADFHGVHVGQGDTAPAEARKI